MTRLVLFVALLFLPENASAQRAPDATRFPPVQPKLESQYAGTLMSFAAAGERYTKRGAIIGGIAGTVVGLGIGAFIALLCEAESDSCGNVVPVIAVIGAVSGTISGAIIGAAIPRTPRPTDEAPVAEGERRRIGSASISIGGAGARLADWSGNELFRGSGLVVRANLYAELKPWLAIGPEVGQAWLDEGGRIRHGAVAVRVSHNGPVFTPYVALNLGAYQSTLPSLEYLGGGIAAGARVKPGHGRLFFDVEGRHSRNAQNIEPMRMNSLAVGVGTYW